MNPANWNAIDGGRDALDDAFRLVEGKAKAMQARFADALDAVGPPGAVSWDPIAGSIELRGQKFSAQQLGSFDGSSWLWSWANTHLAIPEAKTALARGLRDAADRLAVPALRTPMIADDDEELPLVIGGLAIAHGLGEAYYYANRSQIYLVESGQLDKLQPAAPARRRFAVAFSHARRSLADVVAHLRSDKQLAMLAWSQVGDDRVELVGAGFALTLTRRDRLRDVLAEVKALRHGQDGARGAATVFALEGTVDRGYAETAYVNAYGAWARADEFSGAGRVPWQVIAICEQLNRLDRIVLYDVLLDSFYPRS